jgi:hypothetical protein
MGTVPLQTFLATALMTGQETDVTWVRCFTSNLFMCTVTTAICEEARMEGSVSIQTPTTLCPCMYMGGREISVK